MGVGVRASSRANPELVELMFAVVQARRSEHQGIEVPMEDLSAGCDMQQVFRSSQCGCKKAIRDSG